MIDRRIKRGATFRADLILEEAEWDAFWPAEISAAVRQQQQTWPLVIRIEPADRTIVMTADTADWQLGPAAFDLWINRDNIHTPLPFETNIMITVFKGVAR